MFKQSKKRSKYSMNFCVSVVSAPAGLCREAMQNRNQDVTLLCNGN